MEANLLPRVDLPVPVFPSEKVREKPLRKTKPGTANLAALLIKIITIRGKLPGRKLDTGPAEVWITITARQDSARKTSISSSLFFINSHPYSWDKKDALSIKPKHPLRRFSSN
jgi:hypothetical protein